MSWKSSIKADEDTVLSDGASHGLTARATRSPPLLAFVAKEAAVFGRMVFRQRRYFILIMAGEAGSLRFLFAVDGKEGLMDLIMGQERGRFLRGVDKKDQNSGTEGYKCGIDQPFGFWVFCHHRGTRGGG
jgi:hypothetical protein